MSHVTWPIAPIHDLPYHYSYSTFTSSTEPVPYPSALRGSDTRLPSFLDKARTRLTESQPNYDAKAQPVNSIPRGDPILSLLSRTSEILSVLSEPRREGEKGEPQITTTPSTRQRLRKARDQVTQRRVVPLITILLIVITFTYLALRSQPGLGVGASANASAVDEVETIMVVLADGHVDRSWKFVGPTEVPSGILE